MKQGTIVIVEDNPDDEALMLRAFKQHKLTNEIVVLRDGVEAISIYWAPAPISGETRR